MQATLLIEKKLKKLPPNKQKEVSDYVDFLVERYENKEKKKNKRSPKFKFDWERALSELKDKYTSVELQKKALEWR